MESAARKLTAGFILIADYGWPRDEFYAPHRTTGTLRAYSKHRALADPLTQIGQADLTARAEWSSLAEQAAASGLTLRGSVDQHRFITGLLAGEIGREFEDSQAEKTKRALQTLLQPSHLGMKFQFLCLIRNVDPSAGLSGFRFARAPKAALGLSSD